MRKLNTSESIVNTNYPYAHILQTNQPMLTIVEESNIEEPMLTKKQKTTYAIYNFIKNKNKPIFKPFANQVKINSNTINKNRRAKYTLDKNFKLINVKQRTLYASQKYMKDLQMINRKQRELYKY